jgi:hypothetical protein
LAGRTFCSIAFYSSNSKIELHEIEAGKSNQIEPELMLLIIDDGNMESLAIKKCIGK